MSCSGQANPLRSLCVPRHRPLARARRACTREPVLPDAHSSAMDSSGMATQAGRFLAS
jgi:hypothetical protein